MRTVVISRKKVWMVYSLTHTDRHTQHIIHIQYEKTTSHTHTHTHKHTHTHMHTLRGSKSMSNLFIKGGVLTN